MLIFSTCSHYSVRFCCQDRCHKAYLTTLNELRCELPKSIGVYIVANQDLRQVFITGHSEYDPFTLKAEYEHDVAKGLDTAVPVNYYPDDGPSKTALVK